MIDPMVEKIAQEVYCAMAWARDGRDSSVKRAPLWAEGGNSHAQLEARRAASAIIHHAKQEIPGLSSASHLQQRFNTAALAVLTYGATISRLKNMDLAWSELLSAEMKKVDLETAKEKTDAA